MTAEALHCREEKRRDDVRAAKLFGLDYAEVSDDQLTVTVVFLGKAPQKLEKANILLQGGRRIRDVKVTGFSVQRQTDPTLDDSMQIQVNQRGDFSNYSISVVALDDRGLPTNQQFAGFDPRYNSIGFSFKASCPTGLDCKISHSCPPAAQPSPEINYLAKDYASFRQIILDRLALTMPNWKETHVPDIGVALVEILAYAGDYLSYYQDAAATEAYMRTARQRISVRRHARLVDYQMHEGCNARAWMALETDTDLSLDAEQIFFITAYPGVPAQTILTPDDLVGIPVDSYDVFQPLMPSTGTVSLYQAHTEIHFYTWGDSQCCLAKGATAATLLDGWIAPPPVPSSISEPQTRSTSAPGEPLRALNLQPGDVLIFEEVIGPQTGIPADADPTHRQAVRLTRVVQTLDPLYHGGDGLHDRQEDGGGQPIVEIEWEQDDALTFTLCISTQAPPPKCDCLQNVTVARGNVILVDHGAGTNETLGTVTTASTGRRCATLCESAETTYTAGLFRPVLSQRPLTFSQPLSVFASAASLTVQDPRQCVPAITLTAIPPAPTCPAVSEPAPPCQLPSLFTFDDVARPEGLARRLKVPSNPNDSYLYAQLTSTTKQLLSGFDPSQPLPAETAAAIVADLTALTQQWTPQRDLLESSPNALSFVAEVDDDRYAHLRFGDGNLGYLPDAGTSFRANYRVGSGTAGNVGAETIRYIVLRQEKLSGVDLTPRNPLAATGGVDPEPVSEVKLFAPYAFRDTLERAVTADDYAALASDNSRRFGSRYAQAAQGLTSRQANRKFLPPFTYIQGSKATLRWTGSWYTVLVALDPEGEEQSPPSLTREIARYLHPYRRLGHDLLVAQAEYVSLDLSLTVCVLPGYLRAHVEVALLDIFSNRVLPDGSKGFFHPDNLTFGEGIFVSSIVGAAQVVTGVQNVVVTRLERWSFAEVTSVTSDGGLPSNNVLGLGPLEIARLDNNPSFPENGRLSLDMRGGR